MASQSEFTTHKILFFVQVQASVALKRIDKFMNSEELKSDVERLDSNSTNGHSGSGQTETTKNAVEIEDATFQWESNQVPFVVYTRVFDFRPCVLWLWVFIKCNTQMNFYAYAFHRKRIFFNVKQKTDRNKAF